MQDIPNIYLFILQKTEQNCKWQDCANSTRVYLHKYWLQRAISTSLIINEVPIYTLPKSKLYVNSIWSRIENPRLGVKGGCCQRRLRQALLMWASVLTRFKKNTGLCKGCGEVSGLSLISPTVCGRIRKCVTVILASNGVGMENQGRTEPEPCCILGDSVV